MIYKHLTANTVLKVTNRREPGSTNDNKRHITKAKIILPLTIEFDVMVFVPFEQTKTKFSTTKECPTCKAKGNGEQRLKDCVTKRQLD